MDMVDSALKTLGLALLKYDKTFGTYAHGKSLRNSFAAVFGRFFLVRLGLNTFHLETYPKINNFKEPLQVTSSNDTYEIILDQAKK